MPEPVPGFDLYGALAVDPSVDPTDLEVAWRSVMWNVHPDRAGAEPASLAAAKRANVAHDWLSDPAKRARYDAGRDTPAPPQRAKPTSPSSRGAPDLIDPDFGPAIETIHEVLTHLRSATRDQLDRLAVARSALRPDRLDGIAKFLPPARRAAFASALGEMDAILVRVSAPDREAIRGIAGWRILWLLGADLGEGISTARNGEWLMSRPYREATATALRYGPATPEVAAYVARVACLTASERRWLKAPLGSSSRLGSSLRYMWSKAHAADDLGDPPACGGCSVSEELARHDIDAALGLIDLPKAEASRLRARVHRGAEVLIHAGELPRGVVDAELRTWRQTVDTEHYPTLAWRLGTMLRQRRTR